MGPVKVELTLELNEIFLKGTYKSWTYTRVNQMNFFKEGTYGQ